MVKTEYLRVLRHSKKRDLKTIQARLCTADGVNISVVRPPVGTHAGPQAKQQATWAPSGSTHPQQGGDHHVSVSFRNNDCAGLHKSRYSLPSQVSQRVGLLNRNLVQQKEECCDERV